MKTAGPTEGELAFELGLARDIWDGVVASIAELVGPVEQEWKPSKSDFGRMCLIKQKKRTLLYMTPEKGAIRIAIIVSERAVAIALSSGLCGRTRHPICL